MTIKEALQYFINQSLSFRAIEVCGFLGRKNGKYECRIVKNKHPEPDKHFSIDPIEYLRFIKECDVTAIFHSHIQGDCSPSLFDKTNSDNCLVPFLIYSISEKKFGLYEPKDHSSDLKELKAEI